MSAGLRPGRHTEGAIACSQGMAPRRGAARRGVRSASCAALLLALLTVVPVGPGPQAGAATTPDTAPDAGRARSERASGLPWSSGVTPVDISGKEAARFGRKRGARVDNVVVYPGRQSWRDLLSTHWYRALPPYFDPARDDVVVTLPLWPQDRTVRDTGSAARWKKLGARIAAADPDAYVRLGWEMNLQAFYWQLRDRNKVAWVAAFRRAVRLMQTTCPGCRIVWNPNHGRGSSDTSDRAAFRKLEDLIDVYAIDNYDIYPPITNARTRRQHLNGYGQLNESLAFARRHGLPFAVPEWAISCNGPGCQWRGNAGGDNPLYVKTYVDWFSDHARFMAFESYFDEPRRATRSSLYTRPIGPLAGRAYRQAIARALQRQ